MAARRSKGTVGVIGLGIMGGAFAKNLAAAGWRVVGFDTNPARRREAKRAGVEIANNAAEVAAAAPTILTSLPKPQALADTVRKIAAAKLKRKVLVEMSTFAISDKEKAAARLAQSRPCDDRLPGQRHRRAGQEPRPGVLCQRRQEGHCAAGHDPRRPSAATSLMSAPFGNGSRMKYVANLLVAINNVASAEAMVLGMKAGLDPQHDLRSDHAPAPAIRACSNCARR